MTAVYLTEGDVRELLDMEIAIDVVEEAFRQLAAGAAMMALGWAYPEFVDRPFGWLYGSPLGILPCPTLAFLIGATLLLGGLGSRAWDLVLASGWAVLEEQGRPADCVALAYQTSADQDWILFALSNSYEMRPDIVKRFQTVEQLWSGWTATFSKSAVPAGAKLSFWAVDADAPRLYRLKDPTSPTP